jgi:PDZ domain
MSTTASLGTILNAPLTENPMTLLRFRFSICSHLLGHLALAAALTLCSSFASAQNAASPRPDPIAILDAAKAASGGSAWDALRTQRSSVTINTAGVKGSAERWADIYTGRSLVKYSLGPVAGAAGYDGKNAWSQDGSGQSHSESTDAARELAVNAAYRDKLAFWYPDRAPAQISFLDRIADEGATFDVIGIVPEGGRVFQFWINTDTHLIERLVEREAQETRTEYLMDLRQVEGVKVPFRVRATRGDPRQDEVITVDKLDYNWPLTGVLFTQPAAARPDFTFAGESAAIDVPFEVRDGHIFVMVMLNGKGPFRMLFDADRGNILAPRAMAALGVKPQGDFGTAGVGEDQQKIGIARIDRLDLGGVGIDGMLFTAIEVAPLLARIEGVDDVAGVVGYEFLKRFPVKLDFQRSRATFYDPSRFTYAGGGVGVPVTLWEHAAFIGGSVDGFKGMFAIDTSSRGSLALTAPFVEQNGLIKRFGATQTFVSGAGADGYAHSLLARANTLKLGAVAVDRPVVALATQGETADIAGSVGYGILRQFNITFDYANRILYFEKNANYGQPDVFDRSGMWLERGATGFEVVELIKDGPAARAGLAPGNVIVAIDGKAWSAVPLATVRQELKAAPGTKVKVKLGSGQERVITLRDII